jgi:hypothetical protein
LQQNVCFVHYLAPPVFIAVRAGFIVPGSAIDNGAAVQIDNKVVELHKT